MKSFYKTHQYLISQVKSPVRRLLMDEIDWSSRLVGIKGCRGVGKTTLLLQYAKENFQSDDVRCLYVNFNNLYFTTHTLIEFTEEFYKNGGRTLLLDQIFKYENWSKEIRYCYDYFPELQIIFCASTVLRLIEDNKDLEHIVKVYNLHGFSFREFLNLKTGLSLPSYSLAQILQNHHYISNKILEVVNPDEYFKDYLHHGYYPFFLEQRNYSENLLKTINMMMEVDILLIKQIDLKYLSKIRKLLYLIMQCAPCPMNVSQLSEAVQTSRITVMNYIKYLRDARLLNMLYAVGEKFPKKPKSVFPQNTNIMHVLTNNVDEDEEKKTFLYNTLHARHKVNFGKKKTDFLIDEKLHIKYIDKKNNINKKSDIIYVSSNLNNNSDNEVPIWIFGFLY